MTSLKDEAQAYEPKRTLNVADLEKVDLTFPMEDRSGTDKNDKSFTYKVIVVNEQEFRVPNTVLEEIKKILKLRADAKFVKVKKTGTDLATRYTVELIE